MYSNIDSKELFNIVLGDLQMVIDGELDCLSFFPFLDVVIFHPHCSCSNIGCPLLEVLQDIYLFFESIFDTFFNSFFVLRFVISQFFNSY